MAWTLVERGPSNCWCLSSVGCSNIGNREVVRCWNCLPSVIEEIRISILVSTVLGRPDQMFESM